MVTLAVLKLVEFFPARAFPDAPAVHYRGFSQRYARLSADVPHERNALLQARDGHAGREVWPGRAPWLTHVSGSASGTPES